MADVIATSGLRKRLATFIIIGLVVMGGVGLFAWSHYAGRQSTDDAQVDGHIIPTAARVPGTVVAVHVRDNQQVKAGDVLVELDPREYQLALARAEADLADAEAAAAEAAAAVPVTRAMSSSTLSGARAGVERAAAGIDAARAALNAATAHRAAAEARLKEAQATERKTSQDVARLEPLVQKEEVSRAQFDAAVAAADAAHAMVASAEAAIAEADNGVALARSQITQAETGLTSARASVGAAATAPQQVAGTRARASAADARVQRARAAVDQATLNLGHTTIAASRAGLVSRKSVEIGQTVNAGQPLLAIVPLDDVWVTANFKETQLEGMRPGQPVRITIDAYAHALQGRIDSIAAATGARFSLLPPENASGNFVKVVQRVPVKIAFDPGQNPEHRLRPGMSADVTVSIR